MAAATTISPVSYPPINPDQAVTMLLDANARQLALIAFGDGARKDTETFFALRRIGFSPDAIAIHFDRIMDAVGDLRLSKHAA